MAETIPVDLEAPSADEQLTALDDDLNPDDETAIVTAEEPPPLGRSWAFNFDEGQHYMAVGSRGPLQTFGDQTLIAWINKALRTAKGAHAIYPSDYGMTDPGRWVGQTLTVADYDLLETDIHDALTFHPRIADVTDFEWEQEEDDDALFFTCTVVKSDGQRISTDVNL